MLFLIPIACTWLETMAKTLLNAGQRRERIRLRIWTDIPNQAMSLDQNFDEGVALWAAVEPVRSLAMRTEMQTAERPTHLFTILQHVEMRPKDITAQHVIDWKGGRYRVMDAIGLGMPESQMQISAKYLMEIRDGD